MKIAIIGSRSLNGESVEKKIIEGLKNFPSVTHIISGGAVGVDSVAAEVAKFLGIKIIEFLPDYKKYGKGAPHIRNREIVNNSDAVMAIWDGSSKGTIGTVNFAKSMNKKTVIFRL